MNWTTVAYALLAAGAGCCIALQATANTRFRTNLDSPAFAAFFSICGTFATACAFMLAVRPPAPSWDAVKGTQWWNWGGGVHRVGDRRPGRLLAGARPLRSDGPAGDAGHAGQGARGGAGGRRGAV